MKALLDTDILIDVAIYQNEFFAASAKVLDWAQPEPGQAAVAWHTLSNLAYLVHPAARPFIREQLQFVDVAPTSTLHAEQALEFPLADFEDALQVAAALSSGVSFIVTRNLGHFRLSPVTALSPEQFIARLQGT